MGESRIGQLRPVWAQGAAMRTRDPITGEPTFNANPFVMQVETVENSSEVLGIFTPEAQDPLVALAAMLDALGLVKTLQRPEGWPDKLDRPDGINPSDYDYWRRKKALIPEGDFCGGHVDVRGNTHWDPGSYDYPTFIAQVRELQGEGDFMALFETREDFEAYLAKKLPRIIRGAIAGEDAEGKPKFQAIEGDLVTEFIVGMDEAMRGRGATRPTESGPRQRGFDLAVLLTTRGRRQRDTDADVVVAPPDVIVEPE